jgi:superfamily II RNA helicase
MLIVEDLSKPAPEVETP